MTCIKGQPSRNIYGLGGRPIKWTPELIEEEIEALIEWAQDPNNIFLTDFAVSRGYSDKRIHEWRHKHPNLAAACEYVDAKQKSALIKGGLSKKFCYPMCALLLSHHHNMHLKTEQAVTADVTTQGLIAEIADQTKDIIDITDNVKELADESRGAGPEVERSILETEQPLSDSGQEGSPDTV